MNETIEQKVERIEKFLQWEHGSFWWEMTSTLIRYSAFFFLGYTLLAIFTGTLTAQMVETLPTFCEHLK